MDNPNFFVDLEMKLCDIVQYPIILSSAGRYNKDNYPEIRLIEM